MTLSSESRVVGEGPLRTEVSASRIAQVSLCSGCGEITLSEYRWVEPPMERPDDTTIHRLYPGERDTDDLPGRVWDRYAAMLELQHAPDAFAVRAGRLLEAVCADQGVAKSKELPGLYDRLNALVERGDVPRPLVDQAHLVRLYRNLGGHDDEMEVEEQDVPLIRGFTEALLDFLYWGPQNLLRVNAELEYRKILAREKKRAEEEGQ